MSMLSIFISIALLIVSVAVYAYVTIRTVELNRVVDYLSQDIKSMSSTHQDYADRIDKHTLLLKDAERAFNDLYKIMDDLKDDRKNEYNKLRATIAAISRHNKREQVVETDNDQEVHDIPKSLDQMYPQLDLLEQLKAQANQVQPDNVVQARPRLRKIQRLA